MPSASIKLGVTFNKDVTLALLIAVGAWGAGWLIERSDVVSPGASAIAMFAGIAAAIATGLDFAGARTLIVKGLPIAIVMLGFELDLGVLGNASVGMAGIAAIAAALLMSFGVTLAMGRLVGLNSGTALALGAGGAICGNSAVLTVAPLLRLRNEETALVLAAINLLGIGVFAVVVVGAPFLGLDPVAAGIWAGASVHAVPQAIAAGEALGPGGLTVATAVKLSRVTLLMVMVPLFGLLGRRFQGAEDAGPQGSRKFSLPLFVPGFVAAALVGNLAPDAVADGAGYAGRLLLLPVLAAVGLTVTRASIKRSGGRVFVSGFMASTVVTAMTLVAIFIFID